MAPKRYLLALRLKKARRPPTSVSAGLASCPSRGTRAWRQSRNSSRRGSPSADTTPVI